jgi:hypothetical protein
MTQSGLHFKYKINILLLYEKQGIKCKSASREASWKVVTIVQARTRGGRNGDTEKWEYLGWFLVRNNGTGGWIGKRKS